MAVFNQLDYITLLLYFIIVFSVGIYFSRKEDTSEDYFLAGRNLTWWLIGASLIGSNISTEHFVGMSGSGYEIGLAIASYEWIAAITLVLVAKFLMPLFLKKKIYTMPEYLELRYNHVVRLILSLLMMFAYAIIILPVVLYSGGLVFYTLFGVPLVWCIVILSVFTGVYTVYGGLKAVVYTDFIQVLTLMLGGLITTFLGLREIGGVGKFWAASSDKFHMVLPNSHPELPWLGVLVGLWIGNIFYWGCNQYITQRALGARNIKEAQKGLLFAGYLKVLIPFIVVVPGIISYTLYSSEIPRPDMAYPYMIGKLVPKGLLGIIIAALLAAVMSSLSSMLNSFATVFTIDIYRRYINKTCSEKHLIVIGRVSTALAIVIAASIAPFLGRFHLIFSYLQQFWGFIYPGVTVVFLFGIFWKRASAKGAVAALALSPIVLILLQLSLPDMPYLIRILTSFIILSIIMITTSLLVEPDGKIIMDRKEYIKLITTDKSFNRISFVLIGIVVALYVVFF